MYDMNLKQIPLSIESNHVTALVNSIAERNPQKAFQILKDYGADLSGALHVAIGYSNALEVRALINCGVNINQKDNNGMTPLMLALTGILYSPDIPQEIGTARLHEINITIVSFLVRAGCDVLKKDKWGRSAWSLVNNEIFCAICPESQKQAKKLIEEKMKTLGIQPFKKKKITQSFWSRLRMVLRIFKWAARIKVIGVIGAKIKCLFKGGK